ncbi:tyrosine-type recombinase/integrase [Candidatus Saccharibacteria bacterium]|nr:tyrosine-type recombinase/integrase [Candidatus Saccharibacteria bacterium]
MNNYNAYKTFEKQTYNSLKIQSKSKKPVIKQVNDYLDYCANVRQMTIATMRSKECALRIMVGESGIDDLRNFDNKHYDKFVKKEMERGVSARAINTKSAHVIALVRYYREMGLEIPLHIPLIVKLKELPPRRACYTKEEVDYVLDNCNSDMQWLFTKIAFDTGMRISEIKNLTVEQIDGQRIHFIGKGRKEREVYMSGDCYDRLMQYLRDNGIYQGRVWLNEWGYPICVDTVRRVMREVWYRCGYTDFFPHALRHSFGSDIQRQGADIMIIQKMMGHSNITTTQKYLHGLDGQLQQLFATYKA